MKITTGFLILCLSLLSVPTIAEYGPNRIYCPPAEAIYLDERQVFVSDLMPGMPIVWEQLQALSRADESQIKIFFNSGTSLSFYKVSVQEHQKDSLLTSKLVCTYHITSDFIEGFIDLSPRQNELQGSKALSFPVYLKGKKNNQCTQARENCYFVIPQISYRHRLASHQHNNDSDIGRLIFSFLWLSQPLPGQKNHPFNISTIIQPNMATDDYHKTENGLAGITGFQILSEGNINSEERSNILFYGHEGIKIATNYLARPDPKSTGDKLLCSQANFNQSLNDEAASVMDIHVRLVKGKLELFNCSMHLSDLVEFYQESFHDEL